MGANSAGIYGAQLLRSDDKPLYKRGFSVAIGIIAFGLSLAVIRYIDDRRRRVRNQSQLQSNAIVDDQSSEEEARGEKHEKAEPTVKERVGI
jgi:hypothetical protein